MVEDNSTSINENKDSEVRKGQSQNESVTDALLLKLVEDMLAGPRDMTARAEVVANNVDDTIVDTNKVNSDDIINNKNNNNNNNEKIGLLAIATEKEEEEEEEAELNKYNDVNDVDDIDESVYEQLGYMRL